MRGRSGPFFAVIFLAMPVLGRASEVVVPAGTLLQCTISEPNFSSKTAEVGDPLLCAAGPLEEFGRSVFPRGASLVGHFAEYRDPGHFAGKGWMQLNFNRIVLANQVLPLSAKVIHAPHLTVDAKGRMHGRGHAGRDTVEWLIPPLWPWKVVALPLRGPRPTLKGESRITLKLMDDVVVPVAAGETACLPNWQPGQFGVGNCTAGPETANSGFTNPAGDVERSPVSSVSFHSRQVQTAVLNSEEHPSAAAKPLTLLMLKDDTARVASDYWFEGGQWIRYRSINGTAKLLPIANLNLAATVETNRQRGVKFVIRSQNTEE
jgi:hypothetical protein